MSASVPNLNIQTTLGPLDTYSDSRTHGYRGQSRHVRLARVTPSGGGAIAKSEDGLRCAVTGKESLRIVRISDSAQSQGPEHKSAIGRGGHRIDASRNFWDSSGLKIDSASTDVAWGYGLFSNKILTSARNGELIMWDLNKSGAMKYERRTKDHIRSINKLSVSRIVHHYCITGSADGDMRVWDLRDLTKSLMRVKHPTSIRSLVFSPSVWQPLQAVVGLDNGSIHRWDLRMGQRGQLDRLAVAHSAPITTMDWCSSSFSSHPGSAGNLPVDTTGNGLGWLVSGGLDRCVKVWDLTAPNASIHIPNKPTYTLHPSFAVRRVAWRPGYECELALVSNTEFSTQPLDLVQNAPPNVNSGLLTRVGSGLGLDTMLRGFAVETQLGGKEKLTPSSTAETQKSGPSSVGDAIEIWDVRRGWIAKWSLTGSSAEGGVTDIAFTDSHAIWAQQSTGTFSQYDLRDATKPLSTIPRMAATWDIMGSLAFVSDRRSRWEIPYDDIQQPEQRTGSEVRKFAIKALGDPPVHSKTQTIGTFVTATAVEDAEVFTSLARRYMFENGSRKDLCEANAQIAFDAGQEQASQAWWLMAASLTDYVPALPPTSPESPRLKVRKPAPSAIATQPMMSMPTASNTYSFPPVSNLGSDPTISIPHRTSPGRQSIRSGPNNNSLSSPSRSASGSRRLTPTSSNSSSPRHYPMALPSPLTPNRAAFFARRDSVDSGVHRHPSSLRRPSLSITSHNSSPIDRGAVQSLRHVGEGALDDSDSDSADEGDTGEDTAGEDAYDEEGGLALLPSPTAAIVKVPTPSPLSRVAVQQWTEDEDDLDKDRDDEASPSPRSTDTESDESSSSRRQAKSRSSKRNSGRLKSRSRSSTVASLAAPPRQLLHQDSRSSIRTVTAAETSFKEHDQSLSLHLEETLLDLKSGHRRQMSMPISEFVEEIEAEKYEGQALLHNDHNKCSERRIEIICAEEKRFRETAWSVLRNAFEDFAEEGDVQMCSMLSILAREELKIPRRRMLRFLDAYIDYLTRLRLFTCAAYMRRYSEIDEVRDASLTETTIYTSCGKCCKPLVKPSIASTNGEHSRGTFSYCSACKANRVICAICRLPVRALLFQCSICNHGGHQTCYRHYYMEQAMVDLPVSFLPPPHEHRSQGPAWHSNPSLEDDVGSTVSAYNSVIGTSGGQSPVVTDQSSIQKYMGHPCAAGCGHYCWAASGTIETLET